MKQTPNIAIFPSPGISHLIPFVELAKRLVLHHDVHVTCICTSDDDHGPSEAAKAVLESLPKPNTHTIFLPPVNLDDLPRDSQPATKITHTMTRSLPSIRHVLKSLISSSANTPLVAAFADSFAMEVLDIVKGLTDISTYVYFPLNSTALSLFLHLPKLDETAASYDFMRDLPEPVKLPGCPPFRGADLFGSIQDRRTDTYKKIVQTSKRLVSGEGIDGIVLNSFMDIESDVMKALQEEKVKNYLPIYLVGPMVKRGSSSQNDEDHLKCLTWLDNQPRGSVLYASFGSGGTLSYDQMIELAFGLELSGQPFIWVVRRPNNEAPNAAYLDRRPQSPSEVLDFLPNGFLERTKERGLVVPFWAPQTQVLAHASTGGFLSHCGWSSTLESLVEGVPLIAWPLYAEQKMNAVLLVDILKVALRPRADEDGLIRRGEIAHIVKTLMEGTSDEGRVLRDRMNDLKLSAAKALGKDGSSTRALSELASMLKNRAAN